MYSEPEYEYRNDPEVKCPPDSGAFPEPSLIEHAVPETIYNIEHGVQLEYRKELRAEPLLSIPHDRCDPDADLQHEDTDELSQVAEEDIYRSSQIHQTQRKNYVTENVIN